MRFTRLRAWLRLTGRKILKRINQLIDDIARDDPFTGIGTPEPLRHHLSGAWSRRITDEHWLVYLVRDGSLVILAGSLRIATVSSSRKCD